MGQSRSRFWKKSSLTICELWLNLKPEMWVNIFGMVKVMCRCGSGFAISVTFSPKSSDLLVDSWGRQHGIDNWKPQRNRGHSCRILSVQHHFQGYRNLESYRSIWPIPFLESLVFLRRDHHSVFQTPRNFLRSACNNRSALDGVADRFPSQSGLS